MSPVRQLHWCWGAASVIGERTEQQDRCGVLVAPDGSGLLAVVADGMGGHQDGALAAQTVLEVCERFIGSELSALQTEPRQVLAQLYREIQDTLRERSPVAHTTAVVLWLYDRLAHWMHVGDSRCYHFRSGQRLLRTRDHSAVQMLVDLGEIREEDMGSHPVQNRLYRSLGGRQSASPDIASGAFEPGDVFALCSDGVWEYVKDAELWSAGRAGNLERSADQWVRTAVERGGARADNATLVLIRPQEPTSWLRRLFGG